MTDILKYEARQRARGTLVLVVMVSIYVAGLVAMYPSVEASAGALEEYAASLPETIRSSFGIDAITTLGGFLAAEIYQFIWTLMLGLYFAYAAGGTIADEIDAGSIDLLLATPVSRTRVVVEKYLSLLAPILAVNAVMPVVVLAAIISIGESISLTRLLVLHALAIPYFLVTTGIGLALSVAFDRATIPQRGGLGLIFALFTFDAVTLGTDVEWLGAISPTRYYDPTDILVDGHYDVAGALILLAAALALLVFSAEWFRRRDL